MPVETRILDAIEGDIRCQSCGRFVKIGEGKILGYWSPRGNFVLICPKCESKPDVTEVIKDFKQEKV